MLPSDFLPGGFDGTAFVRCFRASSPYINAHRGKTFVVYFGGEAVEDQKFPSLIHDVALIQALGVRLVLVHGIRPQVDRRLNEAGLVPQFHRGFRITDRAALECVKEAGGTVRVEIEAQLSVGLANSPMAGAQIRVTSGNFVTAKPIGVRDGVDFQHTGEVRRVDAEGIRAALDRGNVVLLSAIGYSPTGEIFNLLAEDVATAAAVSLKADKLLLLGERDCISCGSGCLIRQMTTREAEAILASNTQICPDLRPNLQAAAKASAEGVGRTHLLNRHIDGAMLLELYTRDGVGTLVSRTPFEALRRAAVGDVPGILDIILPLELQGVLVPRSRERLESDIEDYWVLDRDGTIIGCAALHVFAEDAMGELACLALRPEYLGGERGERLLQQVEAAAAAAGCTRLFALTTHTAHWFRERGFEPAEPADLPPARRAAYNTGRNSKVLVKALLAS